jgi:hypothetical protein
MAVKTMVINMNNRIDVIYARQSADKKDSISIDSQIEFCKYELKWGSCKEYKDKGYSGKNTDRPKFKEKQRTYLSFHTLADGHGRRGIIRNKCYVVGYIQEKQQ